MVEVGEGGLRIVPAYPLSPWLESQQLLPELRFSVSSRRDNGLNQVPWSWVGCWELGTQQHKAAPSFRLAGHTFQECHEGWLLSCAGIFQRTLSE